MAAIESNIGQFRVELLGRGQISRVIYAASNIPSFEEDIRREQEGAKGLTWYRYLLSHVLCILLSLYMYLYLLFTSYQISHPHDPFYPQRA